MSFWASRRVFSLGVDLSQSRVLKPGPTAAFGPYARLASKSDIVKGFGRVSVRKPLMEEPAGALGLSYGDLCFDLVGSPPCIVARRPRRRRGARTRPS